MLNSIKATDYLGKFDEEEADKIVRLFAVLDNNSGNLNTNANPVTLEERKLLIN